MENFLFLATPQINKKYTPKDKIASIIIINRKLNEEGIQDGNVDHSIIIIEIPNTGPMMNLYFVDFDIFSFFFEINLIPSAIG